MDVVDQQDPNVAQPEQQQQPQPQYQAEVAAAAAGGDGDQALNDPGTSAVLYFKTLSSAVNAAESL